MSTVDQQFEQQFVNREGNMIMIDFASLNKLIIKELNTDLTSAKILKKYTVEDVRCYMERPERYERQLREISVSIYNASSHYRRLIGYFAGMLTLDYVVVPWGGSLISGKLNKKTVMNSYSKVLDYLEIVNLKHEFRKIVTTILREDIFYGYLHIGRDSSYIQTFDPELCQISSVEDGTYCFSFDFAYFKGANEKKLKMYPEEFTAMYEKYLTNTREYRWQEVDSKSAICIKMNEDLPYNLPMFAGVFVDIFNLAEYKALKKAKTKIGNYKLLAQKIPMDEKSEDKNNFKITLDVAQKFHKNISDSLPEEVGVVTSPMSIQEINFDRDQANNDRVAEAVKSIYDEAGVNQVMFNAESTGAIGLDKSIKVDESVMFAILRQIERVMNKKLKVVGTSRFKITMPDITVYNRMDMFDMFLQAGQFGLPTKSLIGASMGVTPSEFLNLSILENDILELQDRFSHPLISSHTTTDDEGGAPTKKSSEISDETARKKK